MYFKFIDNAGVRFYRRRNPFSSPLWILLDKYYEQFEIEFAERYEKVYGFLRPAIGFAVGKFLKCGDLREGFARVHCDGCGHDMFVAFSCKSRCLCPSCHQKRILELGMHIVEDVCFPVPHRQFVWTIPKRLRIFFRFDRSLLKELPKLASQVVKEVYQAVLDRDDIAPGMMAAVQSFGELAHFHPHIHALVTDGAFTSDGNFIPLPKIAAEPFLKLWEQKVFSLLLKEGKITQDVVDNMRNWKHSGFSVNKNVLIRANDSAGLERLVQYISRCPFSLERIIKLTDTDHVVYKAEHKNCRRFPDPGDAALKAGVNRNFQIFAPLDFIAEISQHIPNKGEHTIRYYGLYSNKSRGIRGKNLDFEGAGAECVEEDLPDGQICRSRWAAMIQKVYEVNPLVCPKCGKQMRIIAFIEKKDQPDVVEKILKHCNLWKEPESRAPPQFILEPEYIPMDEFLANF